MSAQPLEHRDGDREETLKVIKELQATFTMTGDIDYLDSAISVAEESGIQPILNKLLEARNALKQGTSHSKKTNIDTRIDSIPQGVGLYKGHEKLRVTKNKRKSESTNESHHGLARAIKRVRWESIMELRKDLALSGCRLQQTLHIHLGGEGATKLTTPTDKSRKQSKVLEKLRASVDGPGDMEVLEGFLEAYKNTGDIDYLDNTISQAERLVALSPNDAIQYHLSIYIHMLENRWTKTEELADLDKLIQWMRVSIDIMPLGDPSQAKLLNKLALTFETRYKRHGNLEDLDKAIEHCKEAITTTPAPSHRLDWLSKLGEKLATSHGQDLGNPEGGIKMDGQVAEYSTQSTPREEGVLGVVSTQEPSGMEYSSGLRKRSPKLYAHETPPSLEEDQRIEAIIKSLLTWHAPRPRVLLNLCNPYDSKYQPPGTLDKIEIAIKQCEAVIEEISPGNASRAILLSNMCQQYTARYERVGNSPDIEKAIRVGEESVLATPPGSSYRSTALLALANSLHLRYRSTDSVKDFYHALRILYECWHCHRTPPTIRIDAACITAILLISRKRWQESGLVIEDALRMLTELYPIPLLGGDEEYYVSRGSQLATLAVSVTLQARNEPVNALKLHVLGQEIVMGFGIDSGNDLSNLRLHYPELSKQLYDLQVAIHSPLVNGGCGSRSYSHQEGSCQQEQVMQDLEGVLCCIRELPGFEQFLLPPLSDSLLSMAREGPIVIFASTSLRSDAIIITSTCIKSLSLPELHYTSAEEWMDQIPKLVREESQVANKKMEELLLWLWDVAVEPVLDELGFCETFNVHGLSRVWWMSQGPLASAPFHAAGDHSPGSTRNTISRVISSYIPTIRSLSYARQKKLDLTAPSSQFLVINKAGVLGSNFTSAQDLINTEDTRDLLGGGMENTIRLDRPGTGQVLTELASSDIIHFACHAVKNGSFPSSTYFLLGEGDCSKLGGEIANNLTVRAISTIKIEKAQIAYLFACGTTEKSSGESINIASAFQLGGFSHVLATQWRRNDIACQQVARDFYRILLGRSGSEEGHRKVSTAFHHAVKRIRDQSLGEPLKWAPFVHSGA